MEFKKENFSKKNKGRSRKADKIKILIVYWSYSFSSKIEKQNQVNPLQVLRNLPLPWLFLPVERFGGGGGVDYIYRLASPGSLYQTSTSKFQIYEVMLVQAIKELIFYFCLLVGNCIENLYF